MKLKEAYNLDRVKLHSGRPTVIEIDGESLVHNLGELKKCLSPDTDIMAIVKSNSYGHGMDIVPTVLSNAGVSHFGVAITEEGIRLRENGIEGTIIILGGVYTGQLDEVINYDLTPVVFSSENARELNSLFAQKGIVKEVHLQVDTGMGRVGVTEPYYEDFFEVIKNCKNLEVVGFMSHFAQSELEDKSFTDIQLERFKKALSILKSKGITPKYVHHSNSAAIVGYKDSEFNLARTGIMLYGAYPHNINSGDGVEDFSAKVKLKPVMTLKTKILDIKKVAKGETVSYGRTYKCEKDSLIALLPIGYGDGLMRGLSNKGEVLINGRRCPIRGRVCMDLTMVDVTEAGASAGDVVVLIGSQGEETIKAEDMASLINTISYEVFCSLTERVPRVLK